MEYLKERREGSGKDMSGGTRYGGELRKERRDLNEGRRYREALSKRKKGSEWRKKIRRRIGKEGRDLL